MERIVYRKTLDVHKNGIQFTLQGFETDDKMARTIEISLMASGDTIDLPLEQMVAMMYITTPNATEPSINECTIEDNKVIYDVLPIVEEGITEMQLKLIDSRLDGAKGVLSTPKFAIEVSESNTKDEGAEQTTTYTALENAIASAKGVYDSRLLRIEIDSECMFRAIYADGTIYESDVLKELYLKGEALTAQSYARGGTGIRVGEDTDNSMYYSNVSKSASIEASEAREHSAELLEETRKHGVYTSFKVDFETGEVIYISPTYDFGINGESGELEVIGKAYTPEETINLVVTEWLANTSAGIDASIKEEKKTRSQNDLQLSEELTAETIKRENADKELTADIFSTQLALEEMKYTLNSMTVDYILARGKTTNGIWKYELWASGKAECWGKTTRDFTDWSIWGDATNFYYCDANAIAYPTNIKVNGETLDNLFCEKPLCFLSWGGNSGNGYILNEYYSDTSSTDFSKYTPHPRAIYYGQANKTVIVEFHAIGRWK